MPGHQVRFTYDDAEVGGMSWKTTWRAAVLVLMTSPVQVLAQTTVFTDVRVFDGEQVLSRATVVLSDGRIVAVGKQVAVPRGAVIVAGAGKTLLPGLIDAHVHTFSHSRLEALRFGVTTELDMFTDWRELAEFKRDRDSLAATTRSDVYSAGTLVTVETGHGTQFGVSIPTLDSAEQADAFIAARVAEGSDFIKLVIEDGTIVGRPLPALSEQSVQAAIRAAKQRHKMAVVHVSTERAALLALAAGADGLMHVFEDQPASAEFIELARAQGAFVVPTLSVIDQHGPGSGPLLVKDRNLQPLLAPTQQLALSNTFRPRANTDQCRANAASSVRRLHAAGIAILAGSDAGNPGTTHGASLHGELELLVRAGLTPSAALAAATSVPARRFGLADRGRIAVGMRADVVLVNGDPTRNIQASRAIAGIWKNGSQVERAIVIPKVERAPEQSLVSDFDTGKPATSYGNGWEISTDALSGGDSAAKLDMVGDGARGTSGSMRITGEVKAHAVHPWAGVLFQVAGGMQPLDYSAKQELVFWAKGDRPGEVMLYSGEEPMPAILPFAASEEWTEFRLPLASFPGAVLERVRAISFVASSPPGKFRLRIDEVAIR
jgi:imidazolonepropionase-like amidohydrolase